jgi:S-formylglutathione hydrolase FrmB
MLAAASLAFAPSGRANFSYCAPYPQPKSPRIVSATLDGIEFNVLLPADYASSPDRRYPVLYFLHAADYNEDTFLDQTDLEQFTAPYTGDRGVIVVTPDGGPLGGYRDWYDGTQLWETYHLARLVPYIDAHFRTLPDRGHRAVAGFSYGGYGAAVYAARHPDLFGTIGSFSGNDHMTAPESAYTGAPAEDVRTDAGNPAPAFDGRPAKPYHPPDDTHSGCGSGGNSMGNPVTEAIDWHNHNPTDLASNLRGLTVWVSAGTGIPCPDGPTSFPSFAAPAEPGDRILTKDFDAALSAAGVAHRSWYPPCGIHNLQGAQRQLHQFWPLLERAFSEPIAATPASFDYRTADPDFSVFGWTFHADPTRAPEFLDVRAASARGVTLTGSGTETVVTGPLVKPGQSVRVSGALPGRATADGAGRLTIRVDLGAADTDEQSAPGAVTRFTSRRVGFEPVRRKARHRHRRRLQS